MNTKLEDYLLLDEPEGWSEAEIDAPAYDPFGEVVLREPWRIDGDRTAIWALRKLRRAHERIADNQASADAQYEQISSWLEAVNAQHQRDAAYFEGLLVDYALRCRVDPDDGRKTITLPGGKVATRTAQPKVSIDSEKFIPWAETNAPQLLRVKTEPALADIKEHITTTDSGIAVTPDGEVIPGVTVTAGDLTANVKIED